jgi:hypothetical protein
VCVCVRLCLCVCSVCFCASAYLGEKGLGGVTAMTVNCLKKKDNISFFFFKQLTVVAVAPHFANSVQKQTTFRIFKLALWGGPPQRALDFFCWGVLAVGK